VRAMTNRFRPPVYAAGNYDVRIGRDLPNEKTISGLKPGPKDSKAKRKVSL